MLSSRLNLAPVLLLVALPSCVTTQIAPQGGERKASQRPARLEHTVKSQVQTTTLLQHCRQGDRYSCTALAVEQEAAGDTAVRENNLAGAVELYERSCSSGRNSACIKGGKTLALKLESDSSSLRSVEFASTHRHAQTLLAEGCANRMQEHCLLQVEIYCGLHRLQQKDPQPNPAAPSSISFARAAMENLLSKTSGNPSNNETPEKIAAACRISKAEVFSMLSFPQGR